MSQDKIEEIARETFTREVQHALQHLYDPTKLRTSPLVTLLEANKQRNPVTALQDILTDAIQQLKPASDVPRQSNAWRIYHILTYRYVEQSSQNTVAANLALSVRQLRRQERVAEQALADYVWSRYELGSDTQKLETLPAEHREDQTSQEQEIEWLRESFPNEIANVRQVVNTVLKTIHPLTETSGVEVACHMPDDLPSVTGQLVALRQALLNLLTAAIHALQQDKGAVQVIVEQDKQEVNIHVRTHETHDPAWPLKSEVVERLQMARRFSEIFQGVLEIASPRDKERPFSATLTLQVADLTSVLVVDDNADTLRLLQRYLSGTRYCFIGANNPEQAFALAAESPPDLIVVDVMMPGIDDWEMIGRMRAHPELQHVPIIVCTILPQEQLAIALGAADFLRKPVSREAFLAALDQQLEKASG